MGLTPSNEQQQINFTKKELNIIYQNFLKMDSNKNGLIEPDEFFDFPELKDNPIVNRIISVFDKNGDGKISFYELVCGLNVLTNESDLKTKLNFAFQFYDMNNDGYISNGDLFNCLKVLVGDNLTDIQIQQLTDRTIIEADQDSDGKIGYEEFCAYVKDIKIQEFFSIDIFNNDKD